MHNKEIIEAICANHLYEYCIANHHFEVIKYSDKISKYCDEEIFSRQYIALFDMVPELVGMEKELAFMFENESEDLLIPLVFKMPNDYINIRVHPNRNFNTLIVLFENITSSTQAQLQLRQANNNNLLLIEEIADKNRQLEVFNQEMQTLVALEVKKNLEKQHMLELQTRHAQMGEMIAMITHQWKQPLSVIQTLCTLLKIKYASGKLTQTLFTEKIDNLLSQANHLNQTVNDFQKFFTPSKKKVNFDMKETMTSVLTLVEMEYALENIKIMLKEETPVSVYGYENEYKQVILSILQNAKDALLASAQENKQISIHIDKRDECSLVTIEDNAGGIPEEILESIFKQYVTTKEDGSGLGLHIAKSVIENNMQGKLWVENMEEGAKFFIQL
jgi:signal transduction histidine kinase